MTSRRRCVPASGAIVNPDLRTRRICLARSSVIVDACMEDSETETFSGSKRSMRSKSSGCTAPYSPVLSELREKLSYPVARTERTTVSRTWLGSRSRVGR
jgi:hypothetical protein